MILGSAELRLRLKAKPPILEPYCGKAIEGSGLEVRVDRLASLEPCVAYMCIETKSTPPLLDLILSGMDVVGDRTEHEGWWLHPHEFYLLTTVEKTNMPDDLSGIITPRSTLQRCGVGLFVANISPGYRGELSFGIINHRSQPFFLERESRVAFIQYAELKEQEEECCYAGNYQGGKRGTDGKSVEHIAGVHNSCLG